MDIFELSRGSQLSMAFYIFIVGPNIKQTSTLIVIDVLTGIYIKQYIYIYDLPSTQSGILPTNTPSSVQI